MTNKTLAVCLHEDDNRGVDILNHIVHHRAQLGVYLRLQGISVPAIYNDSADEKGGVFRD